MGQKDIHDQVNSFFAPQLLKPLKYGENGVFFWIPGSGMSTIVRNVFTSKILLQKHLSGFAKNVKILLLWGDIAESSSLIGLLNSQGFSDFAALEQQVLSWLKSGREVAIVAGFIDIFPEAEKLSLLRHLLRLSAHNRRRVHLIFHSVNKPWFEAQLANRSELFTLANSLEIVPLISGDLLSRYISEFSATYGFSLSAKQRQNLASTYGGILQLVKEYLRSHGPSPLLDTKIRADYQLFPASYRQEIEDHLFHSRSRIHSSAYRDLCEFQAWDLQIFSKHRHILNSDPARLLDQNLTPSEKSFWQQLSSHPGKVFSKEDTINLLRGEHPEDVSLWAADQAVSRFRKKLLRAGLDPSHLKTLKGRGYLWQL